MCENVDKELACVEKKLRLSIDPNKDETNEIFVNVFNKKIRVPEIGLLLETSAAESHNLEYIIYLDLARSDDLSQGIQLSPHILQPIVPMMKEAPVYGPVDSKMERIYEANERALVKLTCDFRKHEIVLSELTEITMNLTKKYATYKKCKIKQNLMEQFALTQLVIKEREEALTESNELKMLSEKIYLAFTIFETQNKENIEARQLSDTIFLKVSLNNAVESLESCSENHTSISDVIPRLPYRDYLNILLSTHSYVSSLLDEMRRVLNFLKLQKSSVECLSILHELLSIDKKYEEIKDNAPLDMDRLELFDFDFVGVREEKKNQFKMEAIWRRLSKCRNDNGETLLDVAFKNGDVEIMNLLLQNGLIEDLIKSYNKAGHTILHSAVNQNRLDMMDIFLSFCTKYDIDACDIRAFGSGDTILHLAVKMRQATENNLDTSSMEELILKYCVNAAEYKNNEGKNAYGRTSFDNNDDYEYIIIPEPTKITCSDGPKVEYNESSYIRSSTRYLENIAREGDVGDKYDDMYSRYRRKMRDGPFGNMYGLKNLNKNIMVPFSSRNSVMKAKIKYELYKPHYSFVALHGANAKLFVELKVSTKEKDYFKNTQYVCWLELTTNKHCNERLQLSPQTIYGHTENSRRSNNVKPIPMIMTDCTDNNVTQEDGCIHRMFNVEFGCILRNIKDLNLVVQLEEKLRAYEEMKSRQRLGESEKKMATDILRKFTIGDVHRVEEEVYFAIFVYEVKSNEILQVGTLFTENPLTVKYCSSVISYQSFYKFRVLKAENKNVLTSTADKADIDYKATESEPLTAEPYPKHTNVIEYLCQLQEALIKAKNETFAHIWNIFRLFNTIYKQELCTISTLFHDAVIIGFFHLIESAINEIPDLDVVNQVWNLMCEWRNWHGETLLHIACETDQFDIISKLLIYYPVDGFKERFEDYQCPLNISIRRHHPLNIVESIANNMLRKEDFNLEVLVVGAILRNNFRLAEILLKVRKNFDFAHSCHKFNLKNVDGPLSKMEILLYGPTSLSIFTEGKSDKDDKDNNKVYQEDFIKLWQVALIRNFSALAESLLIESTATDLEHFGEVVLQKDEFYDLWQAAVQNKCIFLTELLLECQNRDLDHSLSIELEITELRKYLQKAIDENCHNLVVHLLKICKKRNIKVLLRQMDWLNYFKREPSTIFTEILKYFPDAMKLARLKDQFVLCVYKQIPAVMHSELIKRVVKVQISKIKCIETDERKLVHQECNNDHLPCKESLRGKKEKIQKHLNDLLDKIEDIPEDDIKEIFHINKIYKNDALFQNSLFHDAIIVEDWDLVISCVNAIPTDELKVSIKMRFGRWQNVRGETMLHVACEYGKVKAIKPLLANFPVSLYRQTLVPRDTPLHLAIMNRYHRSALTKEFIEYISKMNKDDLMKLLKIYNRQGRTVLHSAIIYECLELVDIILKRCVEHNIDACAIEVLGSGDTILHLAQQLMANGAGKSDKSSMKKIILDNFPNANDYKNYDGRKANDMQFGNNALILTDSLLPNDTKLTNFKLKNEGNVENDTDNPNLDDEYLNHLYYPHLITINPFLEQLYQQLRQAAGKAVDQIWNVFVLLNECYQKEFNTPHTLYHDAVAVGQFENLLNCLQHIVIRVIRDDIVTRLLELRNCNGDTLSHIACKYCYGYDLLLKMRPKQCLVQTSVTLDTPLHILIRLDKGHSIDQLYLTAKDWSHLFCIYNREGYNVLEFAIIKNHMHFVDIFLKKCNELRLDAPVMKVKKTNETILEMIERLEEKSEQYIMTNRMKNLIVKYFPNEKYSIVNVETTLKKLETQLKNSAENNGNELKYDTEKLWHIIIEMNKFYQHEYKVESTLYHDAVSFGLFDTLKCCIESIRLKKAQTNDGNNREQSEVCSKEDSEEDSEDDYVDYIFSHLGELCDYRGETLLHVAIKSDRNFMELYKMCPRAILVQSKLNLATPLHEAIYCRSGFLDFLRTDKKFFGGMYVLRSMQKCNRYGENVLHCAASRNCIKFKNYLIENCKTYNLQYKEISTIGLNKTIRYIIKHSWYEINEYINKSLFVQDSRNLATPLHILVENKMASPDEILLLMPPLLKVLTREEFLKEMRLHNREGYTALHCAILKNDFYLVSKFLDVFEQCNVDPFCIEVKGSGETILQLAGYADAYYVKKSRSMYEFVYSYKRRK